MLEVFLWKLLKLQWETPLKDLIRSHKFWFLPCVIRGQNCRECWDVRAYIFVGNLVKTWLWRDQGGHTLRIPRTFLRTNHLCANARTSKNTSTTYTVNDALLRFLERCERTWLEIEFITWMHCSASTSTQNTQGLYPSATNSCALQWGCRLASMLVGYKLPNCYVVVYCWPLCGYQPVSVRHTKNAFQWNGLKYKRVHAVQNIQISYFLFNIYAIFPLSD